MAYETCPRCGSLREIIDFCKPTEHLGPCDFCRAPETKPRRTR